MSYILYPHCTKYRMRFNSENVVLASLITFQKWWDKLFLESLLKWNVSYNLTKVINTHSFHINGLQNISIALDFFPPHRVKMCLHILI